MNTFGMFFILIYAHGHITKTGISSATTKDKDVSFRKKSILSDCKKKNICTLRDAIAPRLLQRFQKA